MGRRRFHIEDPIEHLTKAIKKLGDNQLFIGIDPGKDGAIAFLPDTSKIVPWVLDIPTEKEVKKSTVKDPKNPGKKKRKTSTRRFYDYHMINRLFDPIIDRVHDGDGPVHVALERQQPRASDSGVTAFSVGVGFGMWHLFFTSFNIPWEEPLPSVWKRKMGLLKTDKDASRRKAKQLFPKAAQFFELVGDHNRAEAVLLAESVRRGFK